MHLMRVCGRHSSRLLFLKVKCPPCFEYGFMVLHHIHIIFFVMGYWWCILTWQGMKNALCVTCVMIIINQAIPNKKSLMLAEPPLWCFPLLKSGWALCKMRVTDKKQSTYWHRSNFQITLTQHLVISKQCVICNLSCITLYLIPQMSILIPLERQTLLSIWGSDYWKLSG